MALFLLSCIRAMVSLEEALLTTPETPDHRSRRAILDRVEPKSPSKTTHSPNGVVCDFFVQIPELDHRSTVAGSAHSITPTVGLEITGLRGADLLGNGAAEHVRDALDRHGVLVYREIHINDDELLALSRRLGAVVVQSTGEHRLPEIQTITLDPTKTDALRVLPSGQLPMAHRRARLRRSPERQRCSQPAPSNPAGGDTQLASTYAAYDALPHDEARPRIASRRTHLRPRPVTRQSRCRRHRTRSVETRSGAGAPLVWTRRNGRKSLLLGATAESIVGWPAQRSRDLLDRLLEWSTQPQFVLRQTWRLAIRSSGTTPACCTGRCPSSRCRSGSCTEPHWQARSRSARQVRQRPRRLHRSAEPAPRCGGHYTSVSMRSWNVAIAGLRWSREAHQGSASPSVITLPVQVTGSASSTPTLSPQPRRPPNYGQKAVKHSTSRWMSRPSRCRSRRNDPTRCVGPIGILVTSAAVAGFTPFDQISIDDWNRHVAVNLTGTFLCVQAVIADMLAAEWGRIVTISSAAGQSGALLQGHYSATKGGVIAMTKTLALEYSRHGVTANTIPPFAIDTPMLRAAQEAKKVPGPEFMARFIPAGRVGTVDDVAATCAFLCSEAAGYITGQVIAPNGGAVM